MRRGRDRKEEKEEKEREREQACANANSHTHAHQQQQTRVEFVSLRALSSQPDGGAVSHPNNMGTAKNHTGYLFNRGRELGTRRQAAARREGGGATDHQSGRPIVTPWSPVEPCTWERPVP